MSNLDSTDGYAKSCPEGHAMEGDDDACYPPYSVMAHCVSFHHLDGCPAFPREADLPTPRTQEGDEG